MSGFHKEECTCPHSPKGHKRSGRCKNGCKCQAARKKAKRKRK